MSPCSILFTKYIQTPSAYKAGCTTDAGVARMCGGVAAATGIPGTQVKVQLENTHYPIGGKWALSHHSLPLYVRNSQSKRGVVALAQSTALAASFPTHIQPPVLLSSTLCTKYIQTPSAYKIGCPTDASVARMCGCVAAATTEGEQLEKVFTFKNSPSSPAEVWGAGRVVLG